MKKIFMFFLLVVYFSIGIYALTIKLGSIAPSRSPWDKALREISREWLRISKGNIKLKIYPNGISGSELSMIRKMKIGSLGGALLSNVGITSIYSDFYIVNIPLLYKNNDEFNSVLKDLNPIFEKEIEKKGYKIIIWLLAGWLRFFTKEPVFNPKDLKRQKLFFTTGDRIIEQSWKRLGFNTVPMELKDLMMGLNTGMVNAFFLPPLVVASGQYFALAKNMMSINVAPVYGAVVVYKRKWDKISDLLKPKLLSLARKIAKNLDEESRKLEIKAIEMMKKNGLKINIPSSEDFKKWKVESDKNMEYLKGRLFSTEIYQRVRKAQSTKK